MLGRFYNWLTGKKPTIHPSQQALHADVDDEPTPTTKDALTDFNDLLSTEKAKINNLLNEWMQHKKDVIGSDAPHSDHDHAMQCPVETEEKVKSIVRLFFEKLKGMFQSAKNNLDDQLKKEVGEHILPLKQHINALCEMANDRHQSDDERRGIVIHICNASIVMLRELEGLTSNFADEIKYCLESEQKEEDTAKIALNASIFMLSGLIGMILPPVDFDFTKEYRNFLSDEIQDPELAYECAVTEAEGTLKKADHLVEGYTENLRGSGGIFSHRPLAAANDAAVEQEKAPTAMPSLR